MLVLFQYACTKTSTITCKKESDVNMSLIINMAWQKSVILCSVQQTDVDRTDHRLFFPKQSSAVTRHKEAALKS